MANKMSKVALAGAVKNIERLFLSGATLHEVKELYRDTELPMSHVTKYRNDLFNRLRSDPQMVKDLANGPMLNPNKVVRYSGMHRAVKSKAFQMSILDACEATPA